MREVVPHPIIEVWLCHCPHLHISSVQFSYRIYVSRSLIIKIMTAALTRSSCEWTFQFSAGQRTVRVSVMSSWFPAADCSMLTDQRLRSFVDRSQLFWSAAQPGHPDLLSVGVWDLAGIIIPGSPLSDRVHWVNSWLCLVSGYIQVMKWRRLWVTV